MTGEEMCQVIADHYKEKTGKTIEPLDIWNMSPTGELWPVYELYYHVLREKDPEKYAEIMQRQQEEFDRKYEKQRELMAAYAENNA